MQDIMVLVPNYNRSAHMSARYVKNLGLIPNFFQKNILCISDL